MALSVQMPTYGSTSGLRRTAIVVLAVLTALVLTACGDGAWRLPLTVVGEPGPDTIRTEFTYLPPAADAPAAGGDEPIPNRLYVIDTTAWRADPEYVEFTPGRVRMYLPQGGVYVVGFTYDPSGTRSGRAIADAITTVGNIDIVSNGIDSLPVSDDAADSVDLGDLGGDEDPFGSAIEPAALAEALGYEESTLNGFAGFDDTLAKAINPDIDQDGILDADENLEWQFRVDYFFSPSSSIRDFQNDQLLTPPSSIDLDVQYEIKFWSGFPDAAPVKETYIELQLEDAEEVLTIPATHANFFDYLDAEYYFALGAFTDLDPPFDGDATVHYGDTKHRFTLLRFFSPRDEFEGFMVLMYEVTVGDDDELDSVSWKWLIYEGGEYRLAGSDEVELRAISLAISFPTVHPDGDVTHEIFWPEETDQWYYVKRESDTREEIERVAIDGPPFSSHGTMLLDDYAINWADVAFVRLDYHDLADNVIVFSYRLP